MPKKQSRRQEFENIFRSVDEDERDLVDRLIDEAVYCEEQLSKLRKMPLIEVNPRNKAQTRMTPAARLYKQLLAGYTNTIRVLMNVLRKVETTERDDLLKRLEEFSLNEND